MLSAATPILPTRISVYFWRSLDIIKQPDLVTAACATFFIPHIVGTRGSGGAPLIDSVNTPQAVRIHSLRMLMESLHFRRHNEVVPAPQIYARFEFQRSPFDVCQSDMACDR